MKKIFLILIFIFILSSLVFAHGEADDSLASSIRGLSIKILLVGASLIIVFTIISVHYQKKLKTIHKKILFLAIVIPAIITTMFLVISTVYLNLNSVTKGPVHWHADFEIYNCGKIVNLEDPEGLSNREGSAVFHEHNDDRIHVEGVVTSYEDITLSEFFEVVGGYLSKEIIIIPTNEGSLELKNGDLCNGKEGKLQVFLYKIINPDKNVYKQEKLEEFTDYVLSPYSLVPPGDCIIIEFGEEKDKTDNICETYKVALEKGELSGN